MSEREEIDARAKAARERLGPFFEQIRRVIVGQSALIDRLLIGLLTDGHLLIEGVPGLAKTLAVRTLARTLRLDFGRVQFTPDLLPADLIGTQVYHPRTGEFTVKHGPIFGNVILADEINRAPAKVQSALLEAMEERQVTIGEESFPLPEPFLVLATQNPIEQEGTYQLPEAQLDRFLLKVVLAYPNAEEELEILDRSGGLRTGVAVEPALGPEDLAELREAVDRTHVDVRIKQYIVAVTQATREPEKLDPGLKPLIQFGASPRGTIALLKAAKANALMNSRGFVVPQDVKDVAPDVLRHRVLISYEAEAEEMTPDDVVAKVLEQVPVP